MSHKMCKHQSSFCCGSFLLMNLPCPGLGGNLNTGGHFGICLNDLGKLRQILLWTHLLATLGRNNFRLTEFLINFLSNVDGSGLRAKNSPASTEPDHWVILEVAFLVSDFLQTPRATWNPSHKRQKDGYDLVTYVGLHHRNGRAPQKPRYCTPC